MEKIDRLERVFTETQKVVDGISADDMGKPTPCAEWDVRALLNHMTGVVMMFGAALTDSPTPSPGDDIVGDDPASVFRSASKTTLDAWRGPDAMSKVIQIPVGEMPGGAAINVNTTDTYAHAVDLAVATGQEGKLDQSLAEEILARVSERGIDALRIPGVFGPEVPCEDSAAAHRRLLAYLGREV